MEGKKSIFSRFKDIDKELFFCALILLGIGTFSIVSASSRETVSHYGVSVFYYFWKNIIWIIAGLFATFVIILFPTKTYKKLVKPLYIGIAAILFYLIIYGSVKRGSINWIEIKGITFQPSEFAKPILIATLAILFEKNNYLLMDPSIKQGNLKFFLFWAAIGILIPGLVFLAGDLGTCLILAGISFMMFFSTNMEEKYKWRYSGILLIAGIVLLLVMYIGRGFALTSEQVSRFNFFNPCSNYENEGYQVCNEMIAINNGGLTGLGIGKSQQKYSYVPEPHTDSIFAIIVEEIGLVAGLIIILLYAWMLKRIYSIAIHATTLRGRYIAFGAFVYLFLHILLNLGGLLAILPLTGVPLPLISYGGSFTISFICMLAMVQVVNIETKNQKIKIGK